MLNYMWIKAQDLSFADLVMLGSSFSRDVALCEF